jgi:hypothetical protein
MVAESEPRAGPGQLHVQLPIVVDLTICDQHHPAVVADHGLVAGGKTDDGQPGLGEAHRPEPVAAAVVGPAVAKASGHGREQRRLGWRAAGTDEARYAAHGERCRRRGWLFGLTGTDRLDYGAHGARPIILPCCRQRHQNAVPGLDAVVV